MVDGTREEALDRYSATEICPGIWLGDSRSALTRSFLDDHDICTVINVTPDVPFLSSLQPPVQPVSTASNPKGKEEEEYARLSLRISVREGREYIQKFFVHLPLAYRCLLAAQRTGSAIFLHCKKGHTRSATVLVYFLARRYNWEVPYAVRYVQRRRPMALRRDVGKNCFLQRLPEFLASMQLE